MSVDTRTPRPGFDDQPALSMVKVDCDPAQVIVNHASFRVRLAQSPRPARAFAPTPRVPAAAGAAGRRRAPVVWSGRSEPGDTGATGLLQAVRNSTATAERGGHRDSAVGATQVIPRIDLDREHPFTGDETAPVPVAAGPLLPPMRQAVGAYDAYPPDDHGPYDGGFGHLGGPLDPDRADRAGRPGADPVRHAYYPGRRMNLGVVLLPLRIFLGLISVYAGMGKLTDPVYFDGGERGSMVKWLTSLHPWPLAEPLRDFALSHPVGAGLTVAFLQVVVGVLTVLGLWQRVAAVVGALLSAALILTVSWRTVPAYDAPDIIFLAAWSPLIIAGAPVYSADGRLAGEAWRTLGPRSQLWELRRRVLRRGAVVAAVVVGLTLLVGSVLGGAVRSSDMVTVPRPNQDPTNHLPGSPLPKDRPSGDRSSSEPGSRERGTPSPSASSSGTTPQERSPEPSAGVAADTGAVGRPSESQGAGQRQAPPTAPARQPVPPPVRSGPSEGGTGGGTGSAPGSSPARSDTPSGSDGPTGPARVIGGLLG
ncbi:DoxX family membrane protein [Streptomyces yaizuensis]|uniref:DoxX family membrane protein n=1 Tax=Streptomyces yaizuensis TaxID=2989713 RepID=A0ABQ5PBI9_9ACTN|nr:DoxX family membrane protein [Streptomyces sp. YSPA8]GLF99949.1 DoxX family membrane protein [Streptomyces sp. YSPA8]